MGDDRRHGEILVADDVSTVMVSVDDIEDRLLGMSPDLLKPKTGIAGQHWRIDQDHACPGNDKAYIGSMEIGFHKNVGCDLSCDDETSF